MFLYIDPYGIQTLDSELFDRFSMFAFASFEMLINFNKIADGTYWQDIVNDFNTGQIDGYQAEERLSTCYKQQLQKRYTYVLDMPIQIKRINHPKYRLVHVCNHEDGCLLMAQNMLKRTDELVLNIHKEGQMSIFDFMSDVSTDSSGNRQLSMM